MNKKKITQAVRSLDLFDSEISLFRLIPCGNGKALDYLKYIRDSVLNSGDMETGSKPLSLLITGFQGKRTHARAFLRSIGVESVDEISMKIMHISADLEHFFALRPQLTGYIISDLDFTSLQLGTEIIRILRESCFSVYEKFKREETIYPVKGIFIMTACDTKALSPETVRHFGHIVKLDDYTTEQRTDIIMQRIQACNVTCERPDVIQGVIRLTNSLPRMLQYIHIAMTIMLSEGRRTLTMSDLMKAVKYVTV